jgi:hypothetical protein
VQGMIMHRFLNVEVPEHNQKDRNRHAGSDPDH